MRSETCCTTRCTWRCSSRCTMQRLCMLWVVSVSCLPPVTWCRGFSTRDARFKTRLHCNCCIEYGHSGSLRSPSYPFHGRSIHAAFPAIPMQPASQPALLLSDSCCSAPAVGSTATAALGHGPSKSRPPDVGVCCGMFVVCSADFDEQEPSWTPQLFMPPNARRQGRTLS
ncbi:hypothetical protein KOR42_34270 [Thalassoglobus neptunius]|uniref:Uncharacterized protein n=1 Tax=Thalassoglobus neptunius TaxID=1938619 RepID=A0A5C5WM96_9PLAN|nr:hypothetical protein KOR42_34270 [Thalassoglobus neptunius]